nr:MAG TPA: YopX protein [Caudoviricetes sp.]
MREIKFKVWHIRERKMYFLEAIDMCFELVTVTKKNSDKQDYAAYFRFSEIELMQYTGIQDKNGVEIYEGDIVKFISRFDDSKKMGTVRYWAGDAAFLIECEREIFFLFYDALNREVLGNIYETPELLQ